MQIAGAGFLSGLVDRFPRQRLAAIGAVVLLHIVLIIALFSAGRITIPPLLQFHEQTIWLQPVSPPARPRQLPPPPEVIAPTKPQTLPPPILTSPIIDEILKRLRLLGPAAPERAPGFNGLRAFGQYMFNCSNARYERLTSEQWELCIGEFLPRREPALTLGTEKPSFWQAQQEGKHKPVTSFESACPQGAVDSNLGLPCYTFTKPNQ